VSEVSEAGRGIGHGQQLAQGVRAAKLMLRTGIGVVRRPGVMDGDPGESAPGPPPARAAPAPARTATRPAPRAAPQQARPPPHQRNQHHHQPHPDITTTQDHPSDDPASPWFRLSTDKWRHAQMDLTSYPEPTAKFDPDRPPPLAGGGRAAGLVMVTDTLWSGSGGHPHAGPDEFFASALGAFLSNPGLQQKIFAHYAKADEKTDKKVDRIAAELTRLLKLLRTRKRLGNSRHCQRRRRRRPRRRLRL
jgi:hypothetical protein